MPCSSLPENHSDTDATNEIAAPRKSRALARPSRAATRAESNVRFCVVSISHHLCSMFVQPIYARSGRLSSLCPGFDYCDMYEPSTRRQPHATPRVETLLEARVAPGQARASEPGTRRGS